MRNPFRKVTEPPVEELDAFERASLQTLIEDQSMNTISDQFWFSLGHVVGAAWKGGVENEHVQNVFRELTERYPEMWPLKKYLPEEKPAPKPPAMD